MPGYQPAWPAVPAPGTGTDWWNGIYPYVKNYQLYVCPSWIRSQTTWNYNQHLFPLMPSYGMNPNLHYNNLPLARINSPSECIMLGDSCHPMGADWRLAWPEAPVVLPGSGNPCNIRTATTTQQDDATVHNLGSNVAFCDGHAKWLKGSTIYEQRATYFTP